MPEEPEKIRVRLAGKLRKVLRDLEQLRNDVEWWNDNRLDAAPMDCEVEKVMIPVIRRMLSAVESKRPIAAGDNQRWKEFVVSDGQDPA